jgi:hypothetical protein
VASVGEKMKEVGTSREEVVKIVESVRRVPTGENCQPWTFEWDGQKLSVFHSPDRARNRINFRDYVSFFSLGFLFETIQIASSAEGLTASFDWNLKNRVSPDHWADVKFKALGQPRDDLFDTLSERFTDRRPFKKGRLDDALFARLKRDAQPFNNCRFYFRGDPTKEFLDYACNAETFFWTNEPFHKDYTRWLRLLKKEVMATRDGLPWRSLGCNYLISRVLLVCKSYKIQSLVNLLGYRSIAKKLVKKQVLSGAGTCCITVNESNVDNLVEAGRLGMRLWLRLNQARFGFHPMSLSALITHYQTLGVAEQIHPTLPELGKQGREALRRHFGYSQNEIPLWVFRTGLSAGFPKQHLTLRLETDELLTFRESK